MAQVPVLEGWIDPAAEGPLPFIVLGDLNCRFTLPNDQVCAELDDGEFASADRITVTQDMSISCRDNTFTEFSITSSSTGESCSGSIVPPSARSPTARPIKPFGISSPTTVGCSSGCGFGNESAAGEDVAGNDLSHSKKQGSTSDRSFSGTFNVPILVSRLNMSVCQGGMQPIGSRGDRRKSSRRGGTSIDCIDGMRSALVCSQGSR